MLRVEVLTVAKNCFAMAVAYMIRSKGAGVVSNADKIAVAMTKRNGP